MRAVAIPIAVVSLLVAGVVFAFTLRQSRPADTPWDKVPAPIKPTDHSHLIQGPFTDAKSKVASIKAPDDKGAELTVQVNLKDQKVTLTVNGVTIESKLQTPLKRITHVGYAMDRAIVDCSPIEIQRR